MNIRSRLDKLSAKVDPGDDENCLCAENQGNEVYTQGPHELPVNDKGEVYSPEIKTCSKCQKPVVRQVIFIQGIPGGPGPGRPLPTLKDLYGQDFECGTFNINTKKEN